MSKKDTEHDDDFALFQEAVQGVKKLRQDTIIQQPKKNTKQKEIKRSNREASDSEFYFSDEFVPLLNEDGPTRYARDDVSTYEVKRLRRGVYVPDVFLDMHGMTQQEAKRELGAMIAEAEGSAGNADIAAGGLLPVKLGNLVSQRLVHSTRSLSQVIASPA